MLRLGYSVVDLSRKELQIFWEKLVKEGKLPKKEEPMGHSRRRDRPGRKKKKITCINCGNRLGKYHNHGLCNECVSKQDAPKGMSIPKMTKNISQ